MSDYIFIPLFIIWYITAIVGGIFNCIAVGNNKEVRVGNLLLGIYSFPISIIVGILYYGRKLFILSLGNNFLNKRMWRLK
jgi:hypothetical protein